MPIPFSTCPVRTVPASGIGDVRWTVMIRRAGSWPGWRWLDRLGDSGSWESAGVLGVIPLLPGLITIPSHLVRWASYRLRRRQDWSVSVYAGVQADYRPRQAVQEENWPDKAAAASRAETLWALLATRDTTDEDRTLPRQSAADGEGVVRRQHERPNEV